MLYTVKIIVSCITMVQTLTEAEYKNLISWLLQMLIMADDYQRSNIQWNTL